MERDKRRFLIQKGFQRFRIDFSVLFRFAEMQGSAVLSGRAAEGMFQCGMFQRGSDDIAFRHMDHCALDRGQQSSRSGVRPDQLPRVRAAESGGETRSRLFQRIGAFHTVKAHGFLIGKEADHDGAEEIDGVRIARTGGGVVKVDRHGHLLSFGKSSIRCGLFLFRVPTCRGWTRAP